MNQESIILELLSMRHCYEILCAWSDNGRISPVPEKVAKAAGRARILLGIDHIRNAFPDSSALESLVSL